ncbi:MAG: hypothetical protein LUF33_02905 [Clostridiales bacterium]|nr:hypothetical protein [Clostridiales bacterium]
MLAVTYVVCLVSTYAKYEICIVISSVILIVPSLLYAVGLEFLSYISVSIPLAMMNLILSSDGFTFLIPVFIIIAAGAISLAAAKRSWCNESRLNNAN